MESKRDRLSFSLFERRKFLVREIGEYIRQNGISSYSDLVDDASVKIRPDWLFCIVKKSSYFMKFIANENLCLLKKFLSIPQFNEIRRGLCIRGDEGFYYAGLVYDIASRFRKINGENHSEHKDDPCVIFHYVLGMNDILLLSEENGLIRYFSFVRSSLVFSRWHNMEKREWLFDDWNLVMDFDFLREGCMTVREWLKKFHPGSEKKIYTDAD